MLSEYTYYSFDKCPMCIAELSASKYLGKRLNQSQGLNPEKISGLATRIYKCCNCLLVYPNPLAMKMRIYNTIVSESLFINRSLVHDHFIYELGVLRNLTTKPLTEMVALDIGFGIGNSLVTLASIFREVHGIEAFEDVYNKAIELNKNKLNTNLLKRCAFEDTKFKEEEFDFIFFEAIQHIRNLGEGMEKVLKWLKPNGIIYVEVPSSSYLITKLINLFYKIKSVDYVINTNPLHGNYSYYEFSDKCFFENGKKLGYEVIHTEVFVCKHQIKGFWGSLLTFIMKHTKTGMQRSIWLKKLVRRS